MHAIYYKRRRNKQKFTGKRFHEIAAGDTGGVSDGPRIVPETVNESGEKPGHVISDAIRRKFGAQFGDARAGGLAHGVIVGARLRDVKIDKRRKLGGDQVNARDLKRVRTEDENPKRCFQSWMKD